MKQQHQISVDKDSQHENEIERSSEYQEFQEYEMKNNIEPKYPIRSVPHDNLPLLCDDNVSIEGKINGFVPTVQANVEINSDASNPSSAGPEQDDDLGNSSASDGEEYEMLDEITTEQMTTFQNSILDRSGALEVESPNQIGVTSSCNLQNSGIKYDQRC